MAQPVNIGPDTTVWVSGPDHLPTPTIVRASIIRVQVRIAEDPLQIEERTAVSSTSGRLYELGVHLKDAIYGRVVRGDILERIPAEGDSTRIIYQRKSPCAIKICSRRKLRELQGRTTENPLAEMGAMQYIGNDHPNIMGLLECCTTDDDLYVIMRYCPGGELFQYISERGPLSNAEAKTMFRQLLNAVSHLQRIGLCHRDMSLENLLYDWEHSHLFVVIDFGMVVKLRRHQRDCIWHGQTYNETTLVNVTDTRSFFQYYCWLPGTPICGKKNYIAPEVFAGLQPINPMLADMWALGIMLCIALIGFPPMDVANDSDERFGHIAEGNLGELLAFWGFDIDPNAVDLLTKMLVVDPLARPTIEEITNHPWLTTP